MNQYSKHIFDFLGKVNFSEKEAKVYLTLLTFGSGTAASISKYTNIKRSTVFFTCEQLLGKKYIYKKQKAKVTHFFPMDPTTISFHLKEQELSLKNRIQEFESFIPILKNLQSSESILPEIEQFEGYEGIVSIIDDQAQKDEPIYFISYHNLDNKLLKYIEKVFIPKRQLMTNKCQMISCADDITPYIRKSQGVYSEIYKIDSKKMPFLLTMSIYDNKVVFINHTGNIDTDTAIMIKNPLIFKSMTSIFFLLKDQCERLI